MMRLILILIGLAVCFYTTAASSQENRRPVVVAGDDRTVAEGAAVMLDGSLSSDPEGEALSFAWRGPDDVALEGPATAQPTFTAPEQLVDDRVLVFTLRVTDASGNASEAEVRITVTADNEAPVVILGPNRSVTEGAVVTLDALSSYDPEGEALSFEWSAPGGVTLDNKNSATPSFIAPFTDSPPMPLFFQVFVIDASGRFARAAVMITVTEAAPGAPFADAGSNQTVDEGDNVMLDGSLSSDPEGEALTYDWATPADVMLVNKRSATPSFIAPFRPPEGRLYFVLVVRDPNGNAVRDSVEILVRRNPAAINDPPVANAGPDQTVDEGATVTLEGSAIDPEGEVVTYLWSGANAALLDDASAARPSFTAPSDLVENQVLVFTLTATDASGNASDAATVSITVTAGPPDIIVAPSELTVQEGGTGSYRVTLSRDPGREVTVVPSSDNADVTLSAARLVFNTGNWDEPQAVTVRAVEDSDSADDRAVIVHAFEGQNAPPGEAGSVTVTVREVDPIIARITDFLLNRANALVNHQPGLVRFLRRDASGDPSRGFNLRATEGNLVFDGSFEQDGIWGKLTGAWSRSDSTESRYVFGALGVHKRYSDTHLVGVMLQFDLADEDLPNGQGAIDGTGWLAGPYFAARHRTHPLYFEGRLLFGRSPCTRQ